MRDVIEVGVYQQTWLDALSRGYVEIERGAILYSHLFFAGMRILFQNLAAGNTGDRLRSALGIDGWYPSWAEKPHMIERLSLDDRFELCQIVGRLLADWPRTFLKAGTRAGIVASDLIGPLKTVPFWYYKVVAANFDARTYSPALPEIESAIQYLRRRNVVVTKKAVSRALGVSDVMRKRQLGWLLQDD